MAPVDLVDSTIVITGATGQVAEPVAIALAATNEVVAGARFRDAAARARLEAAGVRCVPIDLLSGDVSGLPADADYIVNFYNPARRHSSLDYLTPDEFELLASTQNPARTLIEVAH